MQALRVFMTCKVMQYPLIFKIITRFLTLFYIPINLISILMVIMMAACDEAALSALNYILRRLQPTIFSF